MRLDDDASAKRMNRSGCNRLATEISSSIASQWSPTPPPIASHRLRCAGVASSRRGNHTKGTDTIRPSSKTTVSESSEHDASTANASLVSTETGIPFLHQEFSTLFHELSNLRQFVAPKTSVRRQRDRIEPELRVPPGVRDVNVRRLAVLQTVEEEPVAADPQQGWHGCSLLRLRDQGTGRLHLSCERGGQLSVDEKAQSRFPQDWVIVLASGEFEHRRDVVGLEIWIVSEDLLACGAGGKQVEHVFHSDTEATNTRAAAAHIRSHRDSFYRAHIPLPGCCIETKTTMGLPISLQILPRVIQPDLTVLQEPVEFVSGFEPKDTLELHGRELALVIRLEGDGLERRPREVLTRSGQGGRKFVRKVEADLHGASIATEGR
jgi:hypothetical protein